MASLYGMLAKLVEREGEQGALRAARAIQPGLKSLKDASEDTLKRLLGPKTAARPESAAKEVSPEELAMFEREVDQGSDVARKFREEPESAFERSVFSKPSSVAGEQLPPGEMPANFDTKLTVPSTSPVGTLSALKNKKAVTAGAVGAAGLGAGLMATREPSPAPSPAPGPAKPGPTTIAEALAPEPQPTGAAEEPKTLRDRVARGMKQGAAGGAPGVQEEKPLTPEQKLEQRLSSAESKYEKAKEAADYGELMSTLARSLTQLGAAYSGMKSGVDMSGVANKLLTDWDKRRDQIFQEYKNTVSLIKDEQKELTRQAERTEDIQEKRDARKAEAALQKDKLAADERWRLLELSMKSLEIRNKNDKEAAKAQLDVLEPELKSYKNQLDTLAKASSMILDPKKSDEQIAGEVQELMRTQGKDVTSTGFWNQESVKNRKELKNMIDEERKRIENSMSVLQSSIKGLKTMSAAGQVTTPQPTPTTAEQTPPTPAPAPTTGQDAELARKEARRQELLKKAKGQ